MFMHCAMLEVPLLVVMNTLGVILLLILHAAEVAIHFPEKNLGGCSSATTTVCMYTEDMTYTYAYVCAK